MDLPGYDAWKLATPPECESEDACPGCGALDEFDGESCGACGWCDDDDPGSAYDTVAERDMDREP